MTPVALLLISVGAVPTSSTASPSAWDRVKLSTKWYLSYGSGEEDQQTYRKAHISRGYLTMKMKVTDWLQPRVTMDTHQNDDGDWNVRLKYLYGKLILPIETDVITEPNVELGLVHNAWFDFEQNINTYRMQGKMFIERNGMLNSAALGATFAGLIGRKLPKEYQKKVSKKYPGTYGSFAFGLYNGGGYHAEEMNNNTVFMSRVSARPVGWLLPNLQLSYFFIIGKGNTSDEPDWLTHDGMISFEHEYFVFTGQYVMGKGNQKGNKIDLNGQALDLKGYSFFGEIKLPWIRSSLIGRYDWFEWESEDPSLPAIPERRIIVGYAFVLYKKNILLIDLDRVSYTEGDQPADWQVKGTLQVVFK